MNTYIVTVEGVVYDGHVAVGTEVHRVRVTATNEMSARQIAADRVWEPDYRDCVATHVQAV